MNLCIFVKLTLNPFIITIYLKKIYWLIINPTSNYNLISVVYRVFVLCSFVWCFGHAAQYAPIDGVDGNDCAVVLEGSKHFIYNSGKGSPWVTILQWKQIKCLHTKFTLEPSRMYLESEFHFGLKFLARTVQVFEFILPPLKICSDGSTSDIHIHIKCYVRI